MKKYVGLWVLISIILTYEYLTLNQFPQYSILHLLQNQGLLQSWKLNTLPGKRISMYLGCIGFGLMLLTNAYSIRKRFFLHSQALGSLPSWLNFHIFCGLVGPTLILFHTDFKIGGLVAISFWSMVISFSSGIIGRYFYLQITGSKKELEQNSESCWEHFKSNFSRSKSALKNEQLEQELIRIQTQVLTISGASYLGEQGIIQAILGSMRGDFNLRFALPGITASLPERSSYLLKTFAVLRRRANYLSQFQQVMGYWHSFHMPFAFLMYGFAIVHILTALIMMVPE